MLICAGLSIFSKNTVHSILFLILVFCNASGVLFLLNVEYLALVYIIVYVGAIAVLFLFVVMMLNIKLIELNENLILYLPIGAILALIFLFEIFIIIDTDLIPLFSLNFADTLNYIKWTSEITYTTNVARLGSLIYTHYFFLFIIASLILFVAMVGAIMLTLYKNTNLKRQVIYKQISRDFNKAIKLQYLK